MKFRKYKQEDCREIAELFYNTVHTINRLDYSKAQLDAWANGKVDIKKWNEKFENTFTVVCIEENKIIGFGNIDDKGYLDFLYTHCDYQNMGVATGICNELENYTRKDIYTYASITARKFFENRGYKVVRENEVIRRGIVLKNYLMRKSR